MPTSNLNNCLSNIYKLLILINIIFFFTVILKMKFEVKILKYFEDTLFLNSLKQLTTITSSGAQ